VVRQYSFRVSGSDGNRYYDKCAEVPSFRIAVDDQCPTAMNRSRIEKRVDPGADCRCRPRVTETYIDFFTSTIRNRNTRAAYARACWQFFEWCAAHDLELTTVRPFHVAAWIEDFPGSKPTIKGPDRVGVKISFKCGELRT
jgi:hypothetical protein